MKRLTQTQKKEMSIVRRAIAVVGNDLSSIQCWMENSYGFSFNERALRQIIGRIEQVSR